MLDQLKKRGRRLANRCPLCGEDEESLDYILLLCHKTRNLWALLFAMFGVTWVSRYSVLDNLLGWCGFCFRKKY